MAIYKRGEVWWVDVYCGTPPKRVRKSTKTSDEQKARIIEQTLIGANKGTTPRQQAIGIIDMILPKERAGVALKDAVAWYEQCLRDEKIDISKRTVRQRVIVLRTFVEWTKTNTKAITADDIGTEEAFAYAQVLGERGLLGKTLNAYVGDLSTVWKMMIKRSKASNNPWGFVRVRRDKENEHTGRAFTLEEFERMLSVAARVGHDWGGMIILGAYTGFRMGDISRLRWSECDMNERIINLEPSKTKHYGIQVHLPMHDKVYNFLKAAQTGRTSDFILPWRASHPASYKARGSDVTFSTILEMANVGKVDERDKMSFHCFRHTFNSWLYQKGVAEDVRMKLSGHTNRDTHAIYTHGIEQARDAISRLD